MWSLALSAKSLSICPYVLSTMKRKKNTLLYLDSDLVEKAKRENINISRVAEDALRKTLDIKWRPATPREHLQKIFETADERDEGIRETYFLPFQIESITLSNIGPFREFEGHFSPNGVNIIYGPNGSGKSIILRAILFAFGRRHKYFGKRQSGGGTVKLTLFPNQTTVKVTDVESQDCFTKRGGCLIVDDLLARIPRKMIVPLFDEMNRLDNQVIITASLLIDPKTLPNYLHIISLENYSNYR